MNQTRDTRYLLSVLGAYLSSIGLFLWALHLSEALTGTTALCVVLVCIPVFTFFATMSHRIVRLVYLILLAAVLLTVAFLFGNDLPAFLLRLDAFFRGLFELPKSFGSGMYDFAGIFSALLMTIVCLFIYVSAVVFRKAIPIILSVIVAAIASFILLRERNLDFSVLFPACLGILILLFATSKGEKHRAREGDKINRRQLFSLLAAILLISLVLAASVAFERVFSAEKMKSASFKSAINRMVLDIGKELEKPLPLGPQKHLFDPGSFGLNSQIDTLGGPIRETNEIVLEVTASRDLLLKSRTLSEYNTTYWGNGKDSFEMFFEVPDDAPYSIRNRPDLSIPPASDNYQFDVRLFRSSFFDSLRPNRRVVPTLLFDSVITETDVVIRNASEICGATLFYPDHLLDALHSESLYFNESAELYASRNMPIGDSYIVRSMVFRFDNPNFANDLLKLEEFFLEDYQDPDSASQVDSIRDNYLDANVPQSVIDYALEIAAEAETPLEKAFAIRDHLYRNFTYSLDVSEVPEGWDFVEYFLETQKGYCVYFASAMCMMARVNDIPARYTEGFWADVPSDPSGRPSSLIVTSKDAHAWCEIYIEGIGWIPMDATPGGAGSASGYQPDPSNPFVTVTPTPKPTEAPFPSVDPTPGGESTTVSPTAKPTPTRAAESGDPGRFVEPAVLTLVGTLLIVILAGVVLLILLYRNRFLRYYSVPSLQDLSSMKNSGRRLVFLYRRCLNHLGLAGIRIEANESPSDFAARVRSAKPTARGCIHDTVDIDLYAISLAYERMIYGLIPPSDEMINTAHDTCVTVSGHVRTLFFSRIHYHAGVLIRKIKG